TERQQLVQSVTDDVLGYGPIDQLLRDGDITEVMVNGPSSVYVERAGRIETTPVHFVDEVHVRRIIDKIVSQVGRRVDESNPMVAARCVSATSCGTRCVCGRIASSSARSVAVRRSTCCRR